MKMPKGFHSSKSLRNTCLEFFNRSINYGMLCCVWFTLHVWDSSGERVSYWQIYVLYLFLVKGKAVPLQAWSGLEGSRKLSFPDFMTTAQDGGKVVSLTHRPPLPPGNTPGTHFCWRLSLPQGHIATGRIMSLKNSNDTIGNRTRDLPVCSVVP